MTAWRETVDWRGVPAHMREGVARYIERGVPTGHFLAAVFSNDLMEAFRRADEGNANAMRAYASFLYNHCPVGSFGSPAAVRTWIEHRGLEGLIE